MKNAKNDFATLSKCPKLKFSLVQRNFRAPNRICAGSGVSPVLLRCKISHRSQHNARRKSPFSILKKKLTDGRAHTNTTTQRDWKNIFFYFTVKTERKIEIVWLAEPLGSLLGRQNLPHCGFLQSLRKFPPSHSPVSGISRFSAAALPVGLLGKIFAALAPLSPSKFAHRVVVPNAKSLRSESHQCSLVARSEFSFGFFLWMNFLFCSGLTDSCLIE